MTSNEIREKFLKFFENRGHKIIPSASLVPENDPSVLFNTAGMQPLVPYLLGQKHPMGTRLVDVQKCVRTGDIDEVGDNRHLTFFEMLGNWSLGDYFKEEAIKWSFEFLTNKDEGIGLDVNKLYVTVFEGDENAPKDLEAFEIWKKYIPENRVYFLPAKNNWWSAGENGPCGPDTEIFYDVSEQPIGDMTHEEFVKADEEGKVVEIWNNVFMEYEKKDGKVVGKLAQHNVDTGMGLERIVMVSQGVKTVFETDLFNGENTREERIIGDHIKASLFMISDGVIPGNTGRGYVLRRLIRRASRFSKESLSTYIEKVKNIYKDVYDLNDKGIITEEENKFRQTLENGLKKFIRIKSVNGVAISDIKTMGGVPINEVKSINGVLIGNKISGEDAFDLYQNYGFPIELTIEEAKRRGMEVDVESFDKKLKEHQELSRTSSAGMFKGGLANHSEKTIRLHTAHHLLLAGLQEIVSKDIKQKGSNITEERLRMDFICDHKLTEEEKKEVEDWVNDKITRGLNVVRKEMPLLEAEKIGAQMEFGAKYPEVVSVYFIEDENGNAISKEFCGGPHVSNTKELGHFKIQKEEASSQGIRRIKAILE
ncbi:MAG TPA: alanine--tRNA ligase [Candidatus Paceibacterota bacterium]|nr:alanine--tRNA ligase [Candidatus Paceibacterota bacterium]